MRQRLLSDSFFTIECNLAYNVTSNAVVGLHYYDALAVLSESILSDVIPVDCLLARFLYLLSAMTLYTGVLALSGADSTPTAPNREFRILILSAGKPSDDLHGGLVKASLDDDGLDYTALSYTWGDATSPGSIVLNDGHTLPITRNLEAALRQFRLPTEPLRLWVDAICINQADAEEKRSQVEIMRDIYVSAHHTWVWLGPPAADSDEAIDMVQKLHYPGLSPAELRQVNREAWGGIGNLMRRSWWTRVWVIQEVLSAKQVQVWCGRKKVDFDCFVTLEQIRREFAFYHLLMHPFDNILFNWSLNQDTVKRGSAPLFEWIADTHKFESTLRRDRIYALLGLSSAESRNAIVPDYSTRTSDTLLSTQATAHFLMQQKGLLPLQWGFYKKADDLDLPSWVSDWSTSQAGYVPLVFESAFGACGRYTTTTPLFLPVVKHPSALPEDASLILKGVIESRIATAHPMPEVPVYSGTDTDADMRSRILRRDLTRSTCREWKQEFDSFTPSGDVSAATVSAVTHRTAFWRTIITDRLLDTTGPPGLEYGRHFEDWQAGIVSDGATDFQNTAVSRCAGRSFIQCQDGRPGLAPKGARAGDVVCLFHGGDVPFILRPLDSGRYAFVGEAYIHGIMQGEHSFKLGGPDLRDFEIR
ncbi:MAG: hypothetical protein LQ346_006810 [Caloplaca aetnensis]|nr:MAG: hypothetical protein LQ346_006810 [Caloplaca aetnensis]